MAMHGRMMPSVTKDWVLLAPVHELVKESDGIIPRFMKMTSILSSDQDVNNRQRYPAKVRHRPQPRMDATQLPGWDG